MGSLTRKLCTLVDTYRTIRSSHCTMAGAMWMAGLTARMWELMAELLFRRQMADLMVQELAFELVDL